MLSRYDPGSELARVNRMAAEQPVMVSRELHEILERCRMHHAASEGWFDPCHGGPKPFAEALQFTQPCRVGLADANAPLDLGGFGKGYALDAARQILDRFAVTDYLLHGGTSSVLAGGERSWPVNLRSPGDDRVLATIALKNEALSCSAYGDYGTAVIAETGELAEVWSTAILAAGRERRSGWKPERVRAAAWLETEIEWLEVCR
jgi:thiamine biosynthesis lipoprotein